MRKKIQFHGFLIHVLSAITDIALRKHYKQLFLQALRKVIQKLFACYRKRFGLSGTE